MADDAIHTGRPTRGKRRFLAPDPGNEICYECGGDGACVMCGGDGRIEGRMDSYCHGTGRCIVCRGAGQIRAEPKPAE